MNYSGKLRKACQKILQMTKDDRLKWNCELKNMYRTRYKEWYIIIDRGTDEMGIAKAEGDRGKHYTPICYDTGLVRKIKESIESKVVGLREPLDSLLND